MWRFLLAAAVLAMAAWLLLRRAPHEEEFETAPAVAVEDQPDGPLRYPPQLDLDAVLAAVAR